MCFLINLFNLLIYFFHFSFEVLCANRGASIVIGHNCDQKVTSLILHITISKRPTIVYAIATQRDSCFLKGLKWCHKKVILSMDTSNSRGELTAELWYDGHLTVWWIKKIVTNLFLWQNWFVTKQWTKRRDDGFNKWLSPKSHNEMS